MPGYLKWLWNRMLESHPEYADMRVNKSTDPEEMDYEIENYVKTNDPNILEYCIVAKDLFNIKIGLKGDGIFWI